MWSDMTTILQTFLSVAGSVFNLYTSIWFLSGALALILIRKVLKIFNLI